MPGMDYSLYFKGKFVKKNSKRYKILNDLEKGKKVSYPKNDSVTCYRLAELRNANLIKKNKRSFSITNKGKKVLHNAKR
jgi:hypothetical protein